MKNLPQSVLDDIARAEREGRVISNGQRATPLPPGIDEKAFQAAVVREAKRWAWLAYHVRDSRGCEPGFPDWVFCREVCLFVELKKEDGRVSAAQSRWLDALRAAGQTALIWRPSMWNEIEKILETGKMP